MSKPKEKLSAIEIIICILSLLCGGFLIYWSVYFIYAYHFMGILWMFMQPMINLVSELFLGMSLSASAVTLFFNRQKGALLYRFSGFSVIVYAIKQAITKWVEFDLSIDLLAYPAIILAGTFLLLFFNRKRYLFYSKTYNILLFVITVIIFVLINVVFYNWSYH